MFGRKQSPETKVVAEFLKTYTVPPDLLCDAHGDLERLHRIEASMKARARLLPGLALGSVDWRLLAKPTLARTYRDGQAVAPLRQTTRRGPAGGTLTRGA